MKKLLSILLALSLAFSLIACGSATEPAAGKEPAGDKEPVEESQPESTPESTPTETEAPVSDPGPEYTLKETVIVDDENCTFKIMRIDPDGSMGFSIKVFLENKTDKTLMFSWEDVSVMGYMINPFWAAEVAAGKKANEDIFFYSSDEAFEECGITSVDEISFLLRVYDSDDWSADDLINDCFTIYPTGLDADAVEYNQRQAVEGETVIVDNEYCTFIIEGAYMDDIWGYTLKYYVENKTDYPILVCWEDVSVNDFMANVFWASSMPVGKREHSEINISDTDFEQYTTETVEIIEFTLSVTNYESYDEVFSETFTYNP